jgi:hypothetical protein
MNSQQYDRIYRGLMTARVVLKVQFGTAEGADKAVAEEALAEVNDALVALDESAEVEWPDCLAVAA